MQKAPNTVNNRSQNPGNQVVWVRRDNRWKQADVHGLRSLEAQPSFSAVTSLGFLSLSLSLGGWQNYLLHQSWGWAKRSTQRGLHFTQPAPPWPRRHCQSRAGVSVARAIHHFVLLKVFDCPAAQLRGAAAASSLLAPLSRYTDGSV